MTNSILVDGKKDLSHIDVSVAQSLDISVFLVEILYIVLIVMNILQLVSEAPLDYS